MNRKSLIAIVPLALVALLAACEDSPNANAELDNPSPSITSSQAALNEDKNTSNATQSSVANTNNPTLKEEYSIKLINTKIEAEKLQATDSSTYALKKVENDRWELWDKLLNEIYGALKEQLSLEEMEQLRESQREWIKDRDDQALEASLKFKGGTQEHLEYVAVLANLTEERCYELVDRYMK